MESSAMEYFCSSPVSFMSDSSSLTFSSGYTESVCSSTSADGDFDQIWNEHCEDEESLGEYAHAMQHLATEHWASKHPRDDRIKWCHTACMKYFFDGGMAQALQKDRRRREFERLQDANNLNKIESKCNMLNGQCMYEGGQSSVHSECGQRTPCQYNSVSLPVSGQLRLLDVGSCFNPFLEYREFLSVGIDISPAVASVHKCDFLNLQLQQPLEVYSDTVNRYLRTLKSPVETLPRECFHVIVFSLLLSYFPSPYQRWLCVQKAHQLLQLNGLLLIITPDCGKQANTSKMMKSWQTAIESLGFSRWRYHKDARLHFMAFRKISLDPPSQTDSAISPDLLYIPQDYNEESEETVYWDDDELPCEDELFDMGHFPFHNEDEADNPEWPL